MSAGRSPGGKAFRELGIYVFFKTPLEGRTERGTRKNRIKKISQKDKRGKERESEGASLVRRESRGRKLRQKSSGRI